MSKRFVNVRVIGNGRRHVAFLTVLAVGAFAAMAMATDEDPKPETAEPAPKAEASKLPPSTNPTQRVHYANEGQPEEQQMVDQLECYRWASDQTGRDPYEAYDVLVENCSCHSSTTSLTMLRHIQRKRSP